MDNPYAINPRPRPSDWRANRPLRRPTLGPWGVLAPGVLIFAIVVVLYSLSHQLTNRYASIVVYAAQDQVYAEPILRDFERQSQFKVRALYDSEAVKTVGLANRLVAERRRPRCDVFWGNEELRTRQLAAQGVLDATNPFVSLGFRSRRIVVNTNRVQLADAPRSLTDLTNAVWRGRVALAYPLFGTTATHFHALRQHWGEANWLAWCRALQANQPFVVDGNSVVVQLVGRGEATVGLTDSDDITAGQRAGLPITALPLTDESLLIPNTLGRVQGAPHHARARALVEHLRSRAVLDRLVEAGALEGADPGEVDRRTLQPDWATLLRDLESVNTTLKEVFLR